MKATANFDVTSWTPAPYGDEPQQEGGPTLSRATVLKTFRGEIEGTSAAELMLCGSEAKDAGAGYVASERFEGSVDGRAGTFVFHHWGLMGGGVEPTTGGHIVPGSATGELVGITGEVRIDVAADGTHTLTLTYALP